MIWRIVLKSAWHRRAGLLLTIFSIGVSMFLLLGVDKVRKEARNSFVNTVSQTDLIVGARSGPINLLLYSVFRIGNATNNVSWESFEEIAALDEVAWAIPLSLGDSHRGFRVMGTNVDYFRYYRFGEEDPLVFQAGGPFADVYDAVLGAEVADALDYALDDEVIISHGVVATDFAAHDDKPFRVVGILQRTGTPVDRTVHVSLEGIEAIHIDWNAGVRMPLEISAEQARKFDLQPKSLTAFMLGLENRIQTFQVQRAINEYPEEPLLAIVPGVTLTELWRSIGLFEQVLAVLAALVLVSALVGMLTAVLSTLNERRREMAVLRAVGAHPSHIVLLFVLETLMIVVAGCLLGLGLLYVGLVLAQPVLANLYGITIALTPPDAGQWAMIGVAVLLALLISLIPGVIAYRRSVQDGLSIRV